MKPSLLLVLEILVVLTGIVLIATGVFPFAILLLFLIAWASLRLRHMRWRDVGLTRPTGWLATIGLALLIGAAYQALDTVIIAPLLQRLTGESIDLSQFAPLRGNLPLLIVFLLVSWTEAAFIEEMFFRGYLLSRLLDLTGQKRTGVIVALVINAVLFGLGHTYQGFTGVLDTALAGLILGLLYLYARRNLWLAILSHGVLDTIGFLLIYAGLVG